MFGAESAKRTFVVLAVNTADFPIQEIVTAFARRWRSLVFWPIALAIVAAGLSLVLPRVYRSEAKLLVRVGRENSALDPTVTMGEQHVFNVPPSREEEINSVVEVLNARYLAHQVVYQVGPDLILRPESVAPAANHAAPTAVAAWKDRLTSTLEPWLVQLSQLRNLGELSAHEGAIITLQKNLEVSAVKDSSIVKLAFETSDPRAAQKVLDALVNSFLEHHVRLHRMPGGAEFLARQTDQAKEQLAQVETKLAELKRSQGVVSSEEERRALVDRVSALRRELLTTQADRIGSEALIQRVREKMAALPDTQTLTETTGRSHEASTGMRQKLYELQLEEKQLESRYAEDNVRLQQVREQLSSAQAILSGEPIERVEVTRGPGPEFLEAKRILMDTEPRYAALQAKEQALLTQVEQVESLVAAYIATERSLADLSREKDLLDTRYRRFAAELQRAEIDQELEAKRMSNIGIVEPATLEARPRSPNPLVNAAAGGFLGLLLAITWGMWSELASTRVRSVGELESLLAVPVLAHVPRLTKHQLLGNGRARIGTQNARS